MSNLILKIFNFVLPDFRINILKLMVMTLILFYILFQSNLFHLFFKKILSTKITAIPFAIICAIGVMIGCLILVIEALSLLLSPILFLDDMFLKVIRFAIYHLFVLNICKILSVISYQSDILDDSILSFLFVFITSFVVLFAI